MLDKSKTYLIVGLGLLGGKYAQVLSQKGYNVTGITHSQSTLDYALQHGYRFLQSTYEPRLIKEGQTGQI